MFLKDYRKNCLRKLTKQQQIEKPLQILAISHPKYKQDFGFNQQENKSARISEKINQR